MTQTKTCKDNNKDRGETIEAHDLEVQGEREAQEVAARLEEMMATLIKVVLVLVIMMMMIKVGAYNHGGGQVWCQLVRLQKWCLLQRQVSLLEKAPLTEGPLARDSKRRDRGDRDCANFPLTVLNLANSWSNRPFYANIGT